LRRSRSARDLPRDDREVKEEDVRGCLEEARVRAERDGPVDLLGAGEKGGPAANNGLVRALAVETGTRGGGAARRTKLRRRRRRRRSGICRTSKGGVSPPLRRNEGEEDARFLPPVVVLDAADRTSLGRSVSAFAAVLCGREGAESVTALEESQPEGPCAWTRPRCPPTRRTL